MISTKTVLPLIMLFLAIEVNQTEKDYIVF